MGMIRDLLFGGLSGVGEAVANVGRVFVGDKAAGQAQHHDETMTTLNQYAAEFRRLENRTWWDALVDGLNRLPRPLLALGTVGLFAHAMGDPVGFAIRMEGLNLCRTNSGICLARSSASSSAHGNSPMDGRTARRPPRNTGR